MWLIKFARPSGQGLALAACGLLALGACASPAPPQAAAAFHTGPTPLDDFKPRLGQSPDEVALAVHASGLSGAQMLALEGLVRRWRESGGDVVLKVPVGGPDAGGFSAAVSAHLEALGVPPDRLQSKGYDAPDPKAPLIVGFLATTAQSPDCNFPWENISATRTNTVTNHFGCAAAANMAAMIAYPSDLTGATPLSPGDAARREYALGRYREGKITSSEHDDQASGAVSTAVK